MIALLISVLLYSRWILSFSFIKRHFLAFALLASLPFLVICFLPTNMQLLAFHYRGVVTQTNPKIIFARRVLYEVPAEYPLSLLIGLGPGQFDSRASLIGTGLYFGGPLNPKPLPLLKPKTSKAVGRWLMDLWLKVVRRKIPAGSTIKPFSSWLAIITEFGLIGFITVFSITLYLLITIRRWVSRMPTRWKIWLALALSTGILLLFLLGIQAFYWEVPQMILPGVLAFKVMYAHLAPYIDPGLGRSFPA